jgi:excinuclease ABC subunit A
MGPEGGEEGGMAIAVGTPEEVAGQPASHTGRFLAEVLPAAVRAGAAGRAERSPRKRRARIAA